MMRFDFEAARDVALMTIAAVFLLLTPLAFLLSGTVVRQQGISGYNAAMQYSLVGLLASGVVASVATGLIRGRHKES